MKITVSDTRLCVEADPLQGSVVGDTLEVQPYKNGSGLHIYVYQDAEGRGASFDLPRNPVNLLIDSLTMFARAAANKEERQ